MIVKCPSCGARFRLDQNKLAGKRLTLRCSRCRSPFRVEMPHAPAGKAESGARVVLAHSDLRLCRMMQDILADAGLSAGIAQDGEAALALMEKDPPQVVVIDVALQGLYAFEVVEKVRQRPGLEQVKIILLSSVYSKTAYKRSPSSLYNADDYIEKHHIPDDLVPKINKLIIDAAPAGDRRTGGDEGRTEQVVVAAAVTDSQLSFLKSVNDKIQAAENQQVEGHGQGSELDRARRLARIIVADVALYCQEKLDEGIRGGNWVNLLSAEVQEARRLFRERFPAREVQNEKVLEKAFLDLLQHRQQELGL